MNLEPRLIREGDRNRTRAIFGFFAIVVLFSAYGFTQDHVQAEKVARACATLRAEGIDPQKLYDSATTTYARLDRDHDGKACESNK